MATKKTTKATKTTTTTTKKATRKAPAKKAATAATKKPARKAAPKATGATRADDAPTKAKGGKRGAPAKGAKGASAEAKKAKRPSGLDLAAKVLAQAKEPLNAKTIADRAIAAGWQTSGKTPEATLYAAMTREIAKKGKDARFAKVDRGFFTSSGKGA